MIKVGILGAETAAAGELIRILINHPDVSLKTVASESEAGREVSGLHRGLVGDIDMTVSAHPVSSIRQPVAAECVRTLCFRSQYGGILAPPDRRPRRSRPLDSPAFRQKVECLLWIWIKSWNFIYKMGIVLIMRG